MRATFTGSLSVPGAARRLRLRRIVLPVRHGKRFRFRIPVSRRARREVRQALKRRHRVTAIVRVVAVDSAGNRSTRRVKLRIRR